MKKILLVLGAIFAFSLVSCAGNGGDPEPDPIPETKDFVAFEGEEVLTTNAYDNYVDFAAPVTGDYKTFEVTYSWDSATGIQCNAQLMNDASQSSATVSSTSKEEVTLTGACFAGAKYTDYSTGSAVEADCDTQANRIQLFIQDSSYAAVSGDKITVKKVVFKK